MWRGRGAPHSAHRAPGHRCWRSARHAGSRRPDDVATAASSTAGLHDSEGGNNSEYYDECFERRSLGMPGKTMVRHRRLKPRHSDLGAPQMNKKNLAAEFDSAMDEDPQEFLSDDEMRERMAAQVATKPHGEDAPC